MKKVEGVAPFGIYAGNEQADTSIRMLIQNFGADFVNEDRSEVVLNSEAGYKGMEWLVSLKDKGYLATGVEGHKSDDALNLFSQGKSAVLALCNAVQYQKLLRLKAEGKVVEPFELAIVPFPHAEGVEPKTEVNAIGFSIFKAGGEEKVAAAKKLIKFLSTKEGVAANSSHPARKSQPDLGIVKNDPELTYLGSLVTNATDSGYTMPEFGRIRTHWFPNLQAALLGVKTPQQALDDFVIESNKILSESKE